ncbi:hypothetical protein QJQ45_007203 [Haematococcus lacustris]|nr:hypothetical protein QJQ45_007203 [Haematococcus lacustris]
MPDLGWVATEGGMHAFELARHVMQLLDNLLDASTQDAEERFPYIFQHAQGLFAPLQQLQQAFQQHARGADYGNTSAQEATRFTREQLRAYLLYHKVPPRDQPVGNTLVAGWQKAVQKHIAERGSPTRAWEAVQAGLDFESSQQDPALPEINGSPQILIQLNRFNKQLLRAMVDRADERAAMVTAGVKAARRSGRVSSSRVAADADLSSLLGPGAGSNFEGIDASPAVRGVSVVDAEDGVREAGPLSIALVDPSDPCVVVAAAIAKRVALVLLALTVLGVALFFLGLE